MHEPVEVRAIEEKDLLAAFFQRGGELGKGLLFGEAPVPEPVRDAFALQQVRQPGDGVERPRGVDVPPLAQIEIGR
jgi:hypothetical protein